MNKKIIGMASILLISSLTSVSTLAYAMDIMVGTDTMVKAEAMMKNDTMMKHDSMMDSHSMLSMSLGMGAKGAQVSMLQEFLEAKGYLHLPQGAAKGYFGKMTKMALMQYQSSTGISSTGFVGPMTRAKINAGLMMKDDGMMKHDAINEEGVTVGGALMVANKDIVDNAVLANNVTTVVAAVKAAGLVDTLKSTGPFTVFAPNNSAFAKLPAGTVDTLLKPENKAKLVDILTYHVVAGRYKASDLTDGLVLRTVEGKTLTFTRVNGKLMINGSAMVETADVISSNGVTHVINAVLLPQ